MTKVLLATHVKFWLENQGSRRRISSLLKYLAGRGLAPCVYYAGFVSRADLLEIAHNYDELTFYADNVSGTYRHNKFYKRTLSKFLGKISETCDRGRFFGNVQPRGFSGKYAFYRKGYFENIVASETPDFVIIEYISLAYLIEGLRGRQSPRPQLLIDTHDILHVRNQSFAAAGMKHWVDISREEEIFYLEKFDAVIAIQGSDRQALAEMLPGKPVIEVPYPHPVYAHEVRCGPPLSIGYVGAGNPINRESILDFIAGPWRRLRNHYGTLITLDIYGTICADLFRQENVDGVVLHGKFIDLQSVYQALDIVINPVRSGGGLKIKNVEALCHGLPLVTTPCGAQGLEAGIDEAFACGQDDNELYAEICRLVDDFELRKKLSQNAHQYAMNQFNQDKCYESLVKLFTSGPPLMWADKQPC